MSNQQEPVAIGERAAIHKIDRGEQHNNSQGQRSFQVLSANGGSLQVLGGHQQPACYPLQQVGVGANASEQQQHQQQASSLVHHQHAQQFQFHQQMRIVQQQQHQHQQQEAHLHQRQEHYISLSDAQHNNNNDNNNSQANSVGCSTFDEDLSPYWSDSTQSSGDNQLHRSAPDKSGDQRTKRAQTKGARATRDRHQAKSARGNNDDGAQTAATTTANGGIKRKRHMANERERERTKSLNQALEILRNRLPVPDAEKRSKIQTLRTAKEYIEFLARLERTAQETAECDSSSQQTTQCHKSPFAGQTNLNSCSTQTNVTNQQRLTGGNNNNNNNNNTNSIDPQTNQLPDSPLTYKFYKFRHTQKLKR